MYAAEQWAHTVKISGKMDSNLKWNSAYDLYTGEHNTSHHSVDGVKIVAGVTCLLSILGSLAIIFSYIVIKSVRSKARELLVHLSIMDLAFTAANLIGLAIPYDKYLYTSHAQDTYERVCKAQAFIAVYGTIGSVLWTLGLAVYLYYRIVSRDANVTKWVVRMLYVVCYILPLYVSLWLLLTDHLGYPKRGDLSGGWCSINVGGDTADGMEKYDETLMLFMVNDIWMILTFVTIIPIYLIVHCYVRNQVQEYNKEFLLTSGEKHVTLLRADQKFLLVPAVFMVLRVWDIVADQYTDVSGKHKWLKYLDAIGDSGQGFCNFLLFCVFQRKVRDYFKYLLCRCVDREGLTHSVNYMKEEEDNEQLSTSYTPSQLSNFSSDLPND